MDIIANPRMLLNIRRVRSEDANRVHCNSRVKVMDRIGDLPRYGTFSYEPTGISNIMSMLRATKKFRVIFESLGRNFFRMVLPDREVKYQISPNGLYFFDAADRENGVLLLNMVSENRERFTRREYKRDREAQRAMHLLGFLSERYFENMVRSSMILNCTVTFSDVKTPNLFFVVTSPH